MIEGDFEHWDALLVGVRDGDVCGVVVDMTAFECAQRNSVRLRCLDYTFSEEIARQMATNVRGRIGATYGLSVTGIAGPGGATERKPVGLVYLGVAGPSGTRVEECRFRGSRDHIREFSVQRSLALLWQEIGSL